MIPIEVSKYSQQACNLFESCSARESPPGTSHLPTIALTPHYNTKNLHHTAAKTQEHNPLYAQPTPKPQRKILLYGQDRSRFLFPLVRDRDIGIEGAYQDVVIESFNDDDRETTSTQLQRGMVQTLQDLYEVLSRSHSKSSSSSYYTQ